MRHLYVGVSIFVFVGVCLPKDNLGCFQRVQPPYIYAGTFIQPLFWNIFNARGSFRGVGQQRRRRRRRRRRRSWVIRVEPTGWWRLWEDVAKFRQRLLPDGLKSITCLLGMTWLSTFPTYNPRMRLHVFTKVGAVSFSLLTVKPFLPQNLSSNAFVMDLCKWVKAKWMVTMQGLS